MKRKEVMCSSLFFYLSMFTFLLYLNMFPFPANWRLKRNVGTKEIDIFKFHNLFFRKWWFTFTFGNQLVIIMCVLTLSYKEIYDFDSYGLYVCLCAWFLKDLGTSLYTCFWKKNCVHLCPLSVFILAPPLRAGHGCGLWSDQKNGRARNNRLRVCAGCGVC